MQIMITNGRLARTRVMQLSRTQLVLAFVTLLVVLTLLSGTVYHFVFLKAAREGWPVVSQIVRLVVRDEFAQRDRFMRENLDAMAQKVGEMQAKLVKLEAVGERVAGAIGVKPEELRQMLKVSPVDATGAAPRATSAVNTGAPIGAAPRSPATPTSAVTAVPSSLPGGASGGPFVPAQSASLDQLKSIVGALDLEADQRTDLFTLFEARLFESRMQSLMVPTSRPVDVAVGSGFGFRTDPFTGQAALHTGLDFPADVGTPVMAAAGGVVQLSEFQSQYGNVVEIDHGKGLVTRYAHNSKVLVKTGDIVKRSQVIAEVGTTGRSTGPHLHFEVRVEGVAQDPAKFLAAGDSALADNAATKARAPKR
ncbi:MAG: peptidase M23 [Methylibium sp. NZG]|nr:MAG: peptidase M23 [Methylibium sp. NZG]